MRRDTGTLRKTPEILFSTDMNGIITYASPQVNKYGFLVDEVIGRCAQVFRITTRRISTGKRQPARELKENAQFISRFRALDKWGATFRLRRRVPASGLTFRKTYGNVRDPPQCR